MQFASPLIKCTLIKRYKRFLADVLLETGVQITAHTPNTGSMKGCCEPGSTVWLRDSGNPDRKYPLSWEIVEAKPDVLVGINTHLSNQLVQEAIEDGTIAELQGYKIIRREVKYGQENSRIDLLLEDGSQADCYLEVKNVTMVGEGIAAFPDAVSKRGTKHLRELQAMVTQGYRAVIFYCLQRNDALVVQPADEIDPEYGLALREAIENGVEALAYMAEVTPEQISIQQPVPVNCPDL